MIVVAIVAVMAGIVAASVTGLDQDARLAAAATTVRQVRQSIEQHAATSVNGYPATIHASWFAGARMPKHAWTGRPLNVMTVFESEDVILPDQITCSGGGAGPSGWYNATNGSFCVLVPDIGSDEDNHALFAIANDLTLPEEGGGGAGEGGGGAGEGGGGAGEGGDDHHGRRGWGGWRGWRHRHGHRR